MAEGGWGITDATTKRATHVSRVPESGWPPYAFRPPTSTSSMTRQFTRKSKIMKKFKIRIGITRKIRPQSAALPCALDPLPNLNLHPDLPPYPDRKPPPSSSYPLYKIHGDVPTRRENS